MIVCYVCFTVIKKVKEYHKSELGEMIELRTELKVKILEMKTKLNIIQ